MLRKLAIFVAIGLLLLLGMWLKREFEIDDCLDRGGRWNFEVALCDGAQE